MRIYWFYYLCLDILIVVKKRMVFDSELSLADSLRIKNIKFPVVFTIIKKTKTKIKEVLTFLRKTFFYQIDLLFCCDLTMNNLL